ncbi:MAG: dihydropteroate synthase [Candidatus Nanopelagicaceae bacterium]|jgi:dihydropteroate synthase|nr:dihydropteroate synthase [Candidatus Nanopelagicaceae bacterium]
MTLVMGILNVTPDSFSDGGEYLDPAKAIARGLEMVDEGATIIDVGGESTKPGAERVTLEEELTRVIPVVHALAKAGAKVSVDTMRAETAAMAVAAGASIINDVSGGLADPAMHATAAALKVQYICMHWRGQSKEMDSLAVYDDVVTDVINELTKQVASALLAGIEPTKLVVDPGLGFAKNAEQNWEILRNIDKFKELGFPILVGGSRKRFLGGENPSERESSSIALTTWLATKHIWGVRTHSVKPHVDAIKVVGQVL